MENVRLILSAVSSTALWTALVVRMIMSMDRERSAAEQKYVDTESANASA